MNFEQYLLTVKKRAKPFDLPLQVEHGEIGMISEVGELADLIKRAFVYGKPFDPVNLVEECGDILWYAVLYCDCIQIPMLFLEGVAATAESRLALGLDSVAVQEISERHLLKAMAASVGILVAGNLPGEASTSTAERAGMVENLVMSMIMLLHKHGFSMAQTMIVNDAKLEARLQGGVFNAKAILDRNVANERSIMEGSLGALEADSAAG